MLKDYKSMNLERFSAIPILLFFLLFTAFSNKIAKVDKKGDFVVVLDAGHGGHDPGNLGNGYLEKNIALNIVLKVGSILEKSSNIKVLYTRKDDTFVDLFVRGEIANKANADLFVSVHCDSHTSDAHGAGTFVLGLHANKQNFEIAKKENQVIYLEDNYETRYADYNINSPESVIGLTIMQEEFLDQSIALAKAIQDNFSNKLKRKNREVKQAGFIVLHQTFMPSVLVETGFLTNDEEGAYLNSSKGQSQMGTAIAEAILAYRKGVEVNDWQFTNQVNNPVPDPDLEIASSKADAVEKLTEVAEEKIDTAKDQHLSKSENVLLGAENEEIKVDANPTKEILEKKGDNKKPKETVVLKEQAKELKEKIVEKSLPPKRKVVDEKKATIIFKVQLMASNKVIPLISSQFRGLNNLSKEPIKGMFRYMYGSSTTYNEALQLKNVANDKGYTSAYIVAYKDGVRISTTEARKLVSE